MNKQYRLTIEDLQHGGIAAEHDFNTRESAWDMALSDAAEHIDDFSPSICDEYTQYQSMECSGEGRYGDQRLKYTIKEV